ncbi:serine/threonine-protein kinase [Okeania sp. KiyG1]|uniref:serine/threonine-protein kinase n=1 Tax=Okeania sp. KiyG1 TaxID=2720165 RepID=UPI001922B8A8|nr:serine/threonine-protein kinase [Okeania sp. KiyG1]GGA46562.1 hypothetical protein CYANOKiyG1_65590 [Okeania sp. KiyG1]
MTTNQLLDNRYQIIKKLNETNLSITFQGEDSRRFNRLCLIKQLKTSYNPQLQQELEQRFQQEAKILERLGNHPQIPDLYSYFPENNQLYLVQEWIAGCNLQQKFQQEGKLTETELKDILIKLLPVLEFLKENQIVHRDIKPSNIMVNGENLPILIDFGIVKEIYTTVNPNIAYTVLGIGTPGFTSPEQKKGQPTHASDIYSLGATAIYLLTGKISNGKLSWRQDVPNISPEFADILDKSIEENLSDRYQTATEMLTAIKNIKTSYSPNTKQQIPRTQPSLDPNQKVSPVTLTNSGNSQWLKIGIVAIIVGTISTATIIFYNNRQEAKSYYNQGDEHHDRGEYEQAIADLNQAIRLNPKLTKAYNLRGIVYDLQREYEQAIANYSKAIRLNPKSALLYNNRGWTYYNQKEYEKAIADYNQAIRLNRIYPLAYRNRGLVYYKQGKYEKAIADYNQVIQFNPKYADAYYERGLTHKLNKDIEKAISDFEKAADLYKKQANQKSYQKSLDRLKELR